MNAIAASLERAAEYEAEIERLTRELEQQKSVIAEQKSNNFQLVEAWSKINKEQSALIEKLAEALNYYNADHSVWRVADERKLRSEALAAYQQWKEQQ